MPLIVLCGRPLTGKSTRAKSLHSYFTNETHNKCVIISDEEKLDELGPDDLYGNAQKEKQLRSWLKSEVQRNLNCHGMIVILDAANYIKGYRYELYCLTKQCKTTHLIIECQTSSDSFKNNHSGKRSYSKELFEELQHRYEPPNSSNRWEEPLLQIEFYATELPFEKIEDFIFKKGNLKPNKSTQSQPLTTDNFLMELDNQTQNVIKQIQSSLQMNQLQDIKIQGTSVMVNLDKKMTIAELNKYKRQFINYQRMNPINDKDRIVTAFVQFINNGSNF